MDNARLLANYLPIRTTADEAKYIEHLWEVFDSLLNNSNSSVSYSVMPFHLLFIMSLNYKILRLLKTHERETRLFFCVGTGRHRKQLLSDNVSVAEIALVNERTLPELFAVIGLSDESISQIKHIVDYRNETLGHPKLVIEAEPETRILEYIDTAVALSEAFKIENKTLFEGVFDGISKDDDIGSILDIFFNKYFITPDDFLDRFEELLCYKKLSSDQFGALIFLGLDHLSEEEVTNAVINIAKNNSSPKTRLTAVRTLAGLGYMADDIEMEDIVKKEKDPKIVSFIRKNL